MAGWAQRWIPVLAAWLCFGLSSWYQSLWTILRTLISLVIIDLPLHIKRCLGPIWFSGLESGLINCSARGSLWKWFALLLEIAWCRLTTRQGIICVENHPQGASIYSYPTLWTFPEITSELENLEARNPLFSMSFFFLISSSAHFLRCVDYGTGEMARRLRALGVLFLASTWQLPVVCNCNFRELSALF